LLISFAVLVSSTQPPCPEFRFIHNRYLTSNQENFLAIHHRLDRDNSTCNSTIWYIVDDIRMRAAFQFTHQVDIPIRGVSWLADSGLEANAIKAVKERLEAAKAASNV
jgi:hypothetical protein